MDRWDGRVYHRVLVLNGEPVEIAITQSGSPETPRLRIAVNGIGAGPEIEPPLRSLVARLLGTHVDLGEFYRFAESSTMLSKLAGEFRGSKPPRFPTYFETLVNAIACQQLSLTVGIRLLNRLAQAYGPVFQTREGSFYAFPRPEDLVDIDVEELRGLGYSYQKGRYLLNLARLIMDQQFNPDDINTLSDHAALERLCSIKGVGRWTAEYFLLRGLGRTHVFPGDDVGARNNLQRWLGLPHSLDYAGVHRVLAGWENFGGLIYFHLLLKSLVDKGNQFV